MFKFSILKKNILNIKDSLNKIIRQLTNSQTILYGYSAPAKTQTLLSLFDKDIIDKIQFIIEDNPLKQGNYISNTKIKLIDSDDAIEIINNKKSVCIVFAWNMFEEIKNKIISNPKLNPNFVLSPLPSPRMIKLNSN